MKKLESKKIKSDSLPTQNRKQINLLYYRAKGHVDHRTFGV